MDLNLIVESTNFKDNVVMQKQIKESPCNFCLFMQGLMCVDMSKCRWDTHKEIFILKEVREVNEA